jgi:hypothetical protein
VEIDVGGGELGHVTAFVRLPHLLDARAEMGQVRLVPALRCDLGSADLDDAARLGDLLGRLRGVALQGRPAREQHGIERHPACGWIDEGAAPVLDAEDALVAQDPDGFPESQSADPGALRQDGLRRQAAARGIPAVRNHGEQVRRHMVGQAKPYGHHYRPRTIRCQTRTVTVCIEQRQRRLIR